MTLSPSMCGLARADVVRHSFSPQSSEHSCRRTPASDLVVTEEPLQMLLASEPLASTMRTPGHDHEFVAGFLLAEGLVQSRHELGTIHHCGRPEVPIGAIDVLPAPGHVFELDGLEARSRFSNSSCGLCGREQIGDLMARCGRVQSELSVPAAVVRRATEQLAAGQANFARTGGCHAATAVTSEGDVLCTREDVGRHNAVDKVIGRLLLDDLVPASELMLIVSGRISFEIVQKALAAGIPIVVGVSAPSSLAVATAEHAAMALIGFSRGNSFNLYCGAERVA